MKLLGFPFLPPKSFLSVAIGTETITIKPEWASLFQAKENSR